MKPRWMGIGAACVGAASLAVLGTVRASDHLDGPNAIAHPSADITDVFAFTSPENPTHVILAMTVTPYASTTSTFSSAVDYVFRIRRVTAPSPLTLDDTPLDVTCEFDSSMPQKVACTAPGGLSVQTSVDDTTSNADGGMRVFAGRRSDPAFFDRQGALATLANGQAQFTGQNAFAGANVLAIVVDIDALSAFVPISDAGGMEAGTTEDAGPGLPMLAVAAETLLHGEP